MDGCIVSLTIQHPQSRSKNRYQSQTRRCQALRCIFDSKRCLILDHRDSQPLLLPRTKAEVQVNHTTLAFPVSVTVSVCPRASQARIVVISWTRSFVSRVDAAWERSCDSFARRQGCAETWTLAGKDEPMMQRDRLDRWQRW